MIARWPTELPLPIGQGFGRAYGDARLQTRNEGGPPRSRRRFSSTAQAVSMTLSLGRNELARFDRFYLEEIAHGSLPFLMENPTTRDISLADEGGAILTDEDGHPLLMVDVWLCLFGDQVPQVTEGGSPWRIGFNLSVLP